MTWNSPQKPAVYAEQMLIHAILDGGFPPGSQLPAERELAERLGVTRPTLREALQRLGRDGWLFIQQGKSTRVKDIWKEGGLNVLNALVRSGKDLPASFIPNLLEVRLAMAPAYARAAVERQHGRVVELLAHAPAAESSASEYADFDWLLHYSLTVDSENPVYTLIINGFSDFYRQMALRYFQNPAGRAASRQFYTDLLQAAQRGDAPAAEEITRRTMQASIGLWQGLLAGETL